MLVSSMEGMSTERGYSRLLLWVTKVMGGDVWWATGQRSTPRCALENEAHVREGFSLLVFRIIEDMESLGVYQMAVSSLLV